jgi:hypothetical protein
MAWLEIIATRLLISWTKGIQLLYSCKEDDENIESEAFSG